MDLLDRNGKAHASLSGKGASYDLAREDVATRPLREGEKGSRSLL